MSSASGQLQLALGPFRIERCSARISWTSAWASGRSFGISTSSSCSAGWSLLVLLNSAPLDYVFRRGAAEHANGYYAANKQFIAPLPIAVPSGSAAAEIDRLGGRLHTTATAIGVEREGFLTWLSDLMGARVRDLSGWTQIASYDQGTVAELVAVLQKNRARLRTDPTTRAFHDALADAHAESRTRLGELAVSLDRDRREAEERVADLYELTSAQRALIAEDSPRPPR